MTASTERVFYLQGIVCYLSIYSLNPSRTTSSHRAMFATSFNIHRPCLSAIAFSHIVTLFHLRRGMLGTLAAFLSSSGVTNEKTAWKYPPSNLAPHLQQLIYPTIYCLDCFDAWIIANIDLRWFVKSFILINKSRIHFAVILILLQLLQSSW